jgi:hypothetical protein
MDPVGASGLSDQDLMDRAVWVLAAGGSMRIIHEGREPWPETDPVALSDAVRRQMSKRQLADYEILQAQWRKQRGL